MIKKLFMLFSFVLMLTLIVTPAYAQTPTPTQNPGLFSGITQFFTNIFHGKDKSQSSDQQGDGSHSDPQAQEGSNVNPRPSGMPDMTQMQQRRLDMLVKQGKITQAQETAILAELTKVQNELKTWAQAEGIDESYVLGGTGPTMQGFGQGTNQGQREMEDQASRPQMNGGQGQQGGKRFGGNPPQQFQEGSSQQ